MKMQTVRLLESLVSVNNRFSDCAAGDIVQLADFEARNLVDAGIAVMADDQAVAAADAVAAAGDDDALRQQIAKLEETIEKLQDQLAKANKPKQPAKQQPAKQEKKSNPEHTTTPDGCLTLGGD